MINFLSQSMKLLDNLNGQQTLHSLHRAVAYHIKIGNGKFMFRLWKCSNLKCSMLKCSDWKCSDCKHQAGKCWDWQNGMAFLGRHKYEWCCNKHYVIKYNWLENHILGNCSRLLKSCIKWGGAPTPAGTSMFIMWTHIHIHLSPINANCFCFQIACKS